MGTDLPVIKDAAIVGAGYVCGANRPDTHLIGVEPGRDFPYEEMDVRSVQAGDLAPGGHPIEIEPAIEVGQIFKLGARYSEPLGANYLDEDGTERPIMMGSYGIGPARTVAAAIEQRADERGIVWPPQITPWDVHLVGLGKAGDEVTEAADRLYEELESAGLAVVYDDREAGAGEKLTDAELLGCPLRLVVGRRGLADEVVEAQVRHSGADDRLAVAEAASRAAELLDGLSDAEHQQAPPLRPRPFWPEAIGDAARAAAPSAHDPEPRRVYPPGGNPGVPLPRAQLQRRPDGCVGDPLPGDRRE